MATVTYAAKARDSRTLAAAGTSAYWRWQSGEMSTRTARRWCTAKRHGLLL